MIKRTLGQLASMLQAPLYLNAGMESLAADLQAAGVSTDSRQIQPGMLYIPLAGARADGHSFIEQVKEKQAAASLWQKDHLPYPAGIPLILVDNTQEALQQLAKAYLAQLDPYTIGITGSNGKTSTKDLMASVFSRQGKTQKTQGNHNNEIGLPLTILEFDEDIEYAILEMGMENFGEIAFLCSLAPLNEALIVSIGSAHMENLGSRQKIAQAKLEIAQGLKLGGILIWNKDSPELQKLMETGAWKEQENLADNIKTISFGKEGDIRRQGDVEYTGRGIRFQIEGLEEAVEVNAIGDYQADNALAVYAAARAAGIEESRIRQGLKTAELTKMRSALYPAGKARILDDTYKSNPESAASALDTLMKIPGQKHIAVLADMLDLGPAEKELHAQIGQRAKELGVDALYTWGPLSAWTAQAFGGVHYEHKADLIQALKPLLEEDTVLLIKGSRAMKMDEIVRELLQEKE